MIYNICVDERALGQTEFKYVWVELMVFPMGLDKMQNNHF